MIGIKRSTLPVLIAVLAGCGESTSPVNDNPPADDKPAVVSIDAQSTNVDAPLDVIVTISDETVSSVTMSASSDNAALIDESGMAFSGTGTTRTLTLTPKPGKTGTATITVTATDEDDNTASAAFGFTVNAGPPTGPFLWSKLLLASDGEVNLNFGNSVSASGDLIAVGTRAGSGSGATYIFRNDQGTWTETWNVSELGSLFGHTVALDGDYLASAKAGATHLYSRDTPAADSWTSEGMLSASGFMDMSGDRLLIVDPVQVARVYTRSAGVWTQTGTPDPGALDPADAFGSSVSMDGDVAVIGASGDDDAADNAGALYVFRYNGTWTLEQKLTADDGQAEDRLGRAVAVEGDLIVTGVPYIENGASTGAAYVYTRNGGTWTQAAKVAEGDTGDLFGIAVDIDGGEFVVGALRAYKNGRSGAAYHFTGSGSAWTGVILNATGTNSQDGIGASVSINGDVIVLGAPGDDNQGSNSGSAHLFVR